MDEHTNTDQSEYRNDNETAIGGDSCTIQECSKTREADHSIESDDVSQQHTTDAQLVPVTEAIRYRKRAQAAEQKITELIDRLSTAEQHLEDARKTVDEAEQRYRIEQLLVEADAIDIETARLLTEATLAQMSEPDIQSAIDDIRSSKQFLFRQSRQKHNTPQSVTAASSGAIRPATGSGTQISLHDAARSAVTTGSREDLMQYMRLRRNDLPAR